MTTRSERARRWLVGGLTVMVAAVLIPASGQAHRLAGCKSAGRAASYVVPHNWACQAGYVSGLQFEAVAPGETAFIDLYTASSGANVKVLVTKAMKAHGYTGGATQPKPTLGQATVGGQRATTYALHFHGVFDNAESGEISDSIYVLTRSGVAYVISYSSVAPWAVTDHGQFAAFLRSLRFT
jgi:hypothetical protein